MLTGLILYTLLLSYRINSVYSSLPRSGNGEVVQQSIPPNRAVDPNELVQLSERLRSLERKQGREPKLPTTCSVSGDGGKLAKRGDYSAEWIREGSKHFLIVDVEVGSHDRRKKPQSIPVLVDTGFDVLVIPSHTCKFYPRPRLREPCQSPYFFQKLSSTFRPRRTKFTAEFFDTTKVQGIWAVDRVAAGNLVLDRQHFGLVNRIKHRPIDVEAGRANSGILGLGFHPWGILANLARQQLYDEPIFSVYLSDQNHDPSFITFGNTDETKYAGEISYHPLAFPPATRFKDLAWILQSSGILRGNKLVTEPFAVTVDTGAVNVVVPLDVAAAFYAQIDGAYLTCNGIWVYPCTSTLGEVALQFDNNKYPFEAKYLEGGQLQSNPDMCIGVIQGADIEQGIVGGLFLKSYYTVFDYGTRKIGFAPVVRDGKPVTTVVS